MNQLLRQTRSLPAALLVAGVVGCAEEPTAAVLPPEDVELRWSDAFNGIDDQLAAFVPVDIMVYSPADGGPLADALVLVSSDAPVAFLLPQSVDLVESDGCTSDPLEGDPCFGVAWDAWSDLYVAVDEGAATEGEMRLWTDEDGLARLIVRLDAFPVSEDGFEPAMIGLSLGDDLEEGDVSFSLSPR